MPTSNVLTEVKPQSMVVSTINKLYTYAWRLLTDPKLFWILASLVVMADAALTELIIQFVPC